MDADKALKNLIDKYNKTRVNPLGIDKNTELEIRIKNTSRDIFESAYSTMLASDEFAEPRIERTINIISSNIYEIAGSQPDYNQYINKITYEETTSGLQSKEEYLTKHRSIKPVSLNDYLPYTVNIAVEEKSAKFHVSPNANIRFKLRAEFILNDNPNWRFDLTAVKEGSYRDLKNILAKIKTEFFKTGLTPANFLTMIAHELVSRYEIEIEYIGEDDLTVDDFNIVKKIFSMINPQYLAEISYQDEIYHIAQYIVSQNMLHMFRQKNYRLKQLSNQVIALSKNSYQDIFPPTGYYATVKTDGLRCFISIRNKKLMILLSDSMTVVPVAESKDICVDAEYVVSDDVTTLYLFDCIVWQGENVSKQTFEMRLKYLNDACKSINELLSVVEPVTEQRNDIKFTAVVKTYIKLGENFGEQLTQLWSAKHNTEIDGLILTEPSSNYYQTKNYKWKPAEQTTIDFLAMKCPKTGVYPYVKKPNSELYLLFVGISHTMRQKLGLGLITFYKDLFANENSAYYPVQFSPSSNPLAYIYYHPNDSPVQDIHKKIVELSRDNNTWVFHKIREDRKMEATYYGNDFRVAEITYLNYVDPFRFEDLCNGPSGYFAGVAPEFYMASNKYKRYVISTTLKKYISDKPWIIDLASGRGADLHRYQQIGINHALFVDVDAIGLAELVRRKFEFFGAKPKKNIIVGAYDKVQAIEYDKIITKDSKNLTIHTLHADLKTPWEELCNKVRIFGINDGLIDGIVCNFALHYLCDTPAHLQSILTFNNKMLSIGGYFIFSTMDGEKIFNLLTGVAVSHMWESHEGGALKYAIRKNYTSTKLEKAGQMIDVLLPFTAEMVPEPLCNIDYVIAEGKKLGFNLEERKSMGDYFEEFKRADRSLYDKLTQQDIDYISLHTCVIMRKVRNI